MATYAKSGKKRRKKSKVKVALTVAGRLGILLLVTILVLCGTAYLTLFKIKNSSEAARNILITTLMESGQLKFVARMVCSKDEIKEIVATNAMQKMEVEQDTNLITVEANEETGEDAYAGEVFDENGIRLEEIQRSFPGGCRKYLSVE